MAFEFDEGSGGGSEGPWLLWTARGTLDGEIPAKSFFLRTKDGRELFTGFDRGVVLDIENMKTGWCYTEGVQGVPPDWKWNSTLKTFAPKPGDGYKKGFSIPCAISKTETATWEQSGTAAWNAFVALVPSLRDTPIGKLPMVKITGTKAEKFIRGSTVVPILEIAKWVDRPDCLKPDAQAIDTGFNDFDELPAPKQQPKAKPKPEPAPLPADADEF